MCVFSVFVYAKDYVRDSDNLLYPSSISFINELSSEFFEKSGVSVYVIAQEHLQAESIDMLEQHIQKDLQKPFVYILLVKNDKKIDISGTPEIMERINAKDIYWDYIVPLIPSKDSDINSSSLSAFLINGYIALIDDLSHSLNITLENEYVPQNKGIQTASRAILYVMTLSLLVIFIVYLLRTKHA